MSNTPELDISVYSETTEDYLEWKDAGMSA